MPHPHAATAPRVPLTGQIASHLAATELDTLSDRALHLAKQVETMPDLPADTRAWISLQFATIASRLTRAADGLDFRATPPAHGELDLAPFALTSPSGLFQ